MMRAFAVWVVLFCCCCLADSTAMAQTVKLQEGKFQFPKGKTRVRIPFKLIHNLVIIPVQINNSEPLYFIVDTGVDRTLIVEIGLYDSLLLNQVEYMQLRGLGRGKGIAALMSSGNRLRFAGVEALNQEVLVLEQNIFNLSARVGMRVNGIIGYPLFKDFVVEIDYGSKVLNLYKPGHYPARRKKKGTTVPLLILDNKPYVQAEVITPSGQLQKLRLIVDSGMSSSMLLYPSTIPASLIPEKTIKTFLGRGLNGEIHGEVGRIKALKLGNFLFSNPTVSFPDSLSIQHALVLNNRNGNLGADVLHRFRVVFDYGNSEMHLVPNYKYRKPFYFNLTGMELISPFPGQHVYAIAEVIPDSPAHKAGLKAGDSIVSINGQSCFDKDLEEILHILQNKPGRRVSLRISRDSKYFEISLMLKDIL